MVNVVPFGRVVSEVDIRADQLWPELELLSVSQKRGVVPRSEVSDKEARAEDLSNYKRCWVNDIVLNRMSAYQGALGIARQEGIVSPDYAVLRPRANMDAKFLTYLMKSEWFVGQMTSRLRGIGSPGTGSVRTPRVNIQDLRDIDLPAPPVEEQRRIADFLDDQVTRIDSVIALRGQQEALVQEEYGERVADTLLGRKIHGERTETRITPWARDIPADWREIPARFLCRISTGSGDTIDADPDGEYPFYVRSDNAEQSRSYSFDCEAVLTSGDGAGVGKVFHLVSGRFHAHQRVYVLTDFRYLSAEYFYFYFSAFFRNMALDGSAKSTVDSVRRDMIAGMPFLVPPVGVQSEIVDELLHVQQTNGHVTAALRGAVQLLEERRRALITAAVTGELDVTTASPIGMGKWVPNVGASVEAPAAAQSSSIGGIG